MYTQCEAAARQAGKHFIIVSWLNAARRSAGQYETGCWLIDEWLRGAHSDEMCEGLRDVQGHRLGGVQAEKIGAVYTIAHGSPSTNSDQIIGKLTAGEYQLRTVTSMPYMRDSEVFSYKIKIEWNELAAPIIHCDNVTCDGLPKELGTSITVSDVGQSWVSITNVESPTGIGTMQATQYSETGPIFLGDVGSYIVTALSYKHGYIQSASASADVEVVQALLMQPTFMPELKNHFEPVVLTMNVSDPAATIFYTIDGTEPTTNSSSCLPSQPCTLTLDASTTVSAFATVANHGYKPSDVSVVRYEVLSPMVVLDSHNWGPASGGNTIALTLHNAPHWRSWLSAGASDIVVFFGTAITATVIEVEYSKSCNDNFCDTVGIKVIVPAASDMLNNAQSLRAVEIQMQLQGGQTFTTTGSGAEYTYDALVPTVESVSPSRGSVPGPMYIDLQVRYISCLQTQLWLMQPMRLWHQAKRTCKMCKHTAKHLIWHHLQTIFV